MMTLCNWLRRVFAQKTSSLGSTTGYRTTKEGFWIYPTQNRRSIFILRTMPHPCQGFRASEIRKFSAAATGFYPCLKAFMLPGGSLLPLNPAFRFVPGVEIHSLQLVSL